jgi:hypothetical protein
MKITKLKTGLRGYLSAVDAAFTSKKMSPCVRYSCARGFYVESALCPPAQDVLWTGSAYYHADSGERSLRRADYVEIRCKIIEELAQK